MQFVVSFPYFVRGEPHLLRSWWASPTPFVVSLSNHERSWLTVFVLSASTRLPW